MSFSNTLQNATQALQRFIDTLSRFNTGAAVGGTGGAGGAGPTPVGGFLGGTSITAKPANRITLRATNEAINIVGAVAQATGERFTASYLGASDPAARGFDWFRRFVGNNIPFVGGVSGYQATSELGDIIAGGGLNQMAVAAGEGGIRLEKQFFRKMATARLPRAVAVAGNLEDAQGESVSVASEYVNRDLNAAADKLAEVLNNISDNLDRAAKSFEKSVDEALSGGRGSR